MNAVFHRRDFLRAAAFSVGSGMMLRASGLRAEEKKVRSHGPWNMFKPDVKTWVERSVMPPPEEKKLTEAIFASTRLENVFYLDIGEHAVVIDSGYHHQAEHHLRNFEKLGRDLKKVRAILATHSHVDHTAGLKRASTLLNAPVVAHKHAKAPIESGDLLRTAAVITELPGWEFEYPPCKIDHFVDERDVLKIGEETISVVHIPGHTPDSVGYVWRDHFFTGDAVFAGGLVGWAHERWLSNYGDHAESMQRLIDGGPEKSGRFYCAHGPAFDYGEHIPAAVKKTLAKLTPIDEDPCNHTPKVARRDTNEKGREISLV